MKHALVNRRLFTKASLAEKKSSPRTGRFLAVWVLCLGFAGIAGAATRSWTGGNGGIEDPAKWGGTLPGAGDTGSVNVSGDFVVKYPADKAHTNFYQSSFWAQSGYTITFSGTNATVVTPTMETDTYSNEPLVMGAAGGRLFDVQSYWGTSSYQKTRSPFRFSDFSYRLVGSATAPAIHFDRGTYEFDPDNSKTRKHWFFSTGTADSRHYSVNFHQGSSVTLASILYGVNPMDAVIRFDGGTHRQSAAAASGDNNFSYNNGGTDAVGKQSRLEVVGDGTSFTLESSSNVGYDSFPNRTFTFLAADGGRLTLAGGISANLAGTHVFAATNGGTLAMYGGNFATNGTGNAVIRADDASFTTIGGVTYLGGTTGGGSLMAAFTNSTVSLSNRWQVGTSATVGAKGGLLESIADAPIHFTGGTFATDGTALDLHGALYLKGGTAVFGDSHGFVTNVFVGNVAGTTSTLTLAGGAVTNYGVFTVGYNGTGTLSVTGGRHVFHAGKSTKTENGTINEYAKAAAVGEYGTGVVNVSGEGTEVVYDTPQAIYVGAEADSSGTLNVSGGRLVLGQTGASQYFTAVASSRAAVHLTGGTLEVRDNMHVPRGAFEFQQTGGTFKTTNLYMGDYDGSSGSVMTFKMTGGESVVSGNFLVTCTGVYKGSVTLDGGTLSVYTIAGGNYCAWNGKTGTATFSANGGTLKALGANADFMRRFDTATLGADGLVIDTDYDITIAQPFTAADGVTGRLVKRGTGTLTLSAAVPENIAIVVEEGVVRFAADSTPAALTLGTETSAGGIAIADGVTLSVKGTVTRTRDGSTEEHAFTYDAETGATAVTVDASAAKTLSINLDAGSSNATENVSFRNQDTLSVTVAAGAALSLDGRYEHGAFVKRGDGAATLTSAENQFNTGVTLESGLLMLQSLSALGLDYAVSPTFVQEGGTLVLKGSGTFPAAVTVDAGAKTAAVIVRNDADVTIDKSFTLTKGALIKRGAGILRFETPGNTSLACDNGSNCLSRTLFTPDDANGTPPTTGYAGFNVAEGEVILANGSYNINSSGYVGMRLDRAPAAEPTLTFTNATVSLNGSRQYMFFVGSCVSNVDPVQRFALNVIESSVSGNTPFCIGGYAGCTAVSSTSRVDVLMRDSTLTASYGVWFNENTSGGKAYWTINNSALYCKAGSRSMGYSAVEFTNGAVFASSAALDATSYPEAHNDTSANCGYMRFNAGTHAYLDSVGGKGAFFKTSLCFNGGTWHAGALPKVRCVAGYIQSGVHVVFENQGAVWPVESDLCRNTIRIEGMGGLVKTGAGELFFDTASTWETWSDASNPGETKITSAEWIPTWRFTGAVEVREGTFSVTNGALASTVTPVVKVASGTTWKLLGDMAITNATVSGAGTVTGGTLKDLTVKGILAADGTAGAVPTLESTLAGRVCVDFGGACEKCEKLPRNILVAKTTSADGASWRATNFGVKFVRAIFHSAGGEVRCDVVRKGFCINLR